MSRIVLLLFIVFGVQWSAYGQQSSTPAKNQYVVLPTDIAVLVVAAQPGCPVHLENARVLMNVQQQSLVFSYEIRNTGSKPILRWQTMDFTSLGTGGTLSADSAYSSNKVLLPGAVKHEEDSGSIIPLTDELKKRLHLEKYKGMMVALLVNSVTYADGSKYEDPLTVTTIHGYFERLATDLNRLENLSLQKHLGSIKR